MTLSDNERHQHCVGRFIDLANELKDQGYDIALVSAAMMTASGVYATYSVVGNEGGLNPSGIDKVVAVYRRNLEHIQELKKAELERSKAESTGS